MAIKVLIVGCARSGCLDLIKKLLSEDPKYANVEIVLESSLDCVAAPDMILNNKIAIYDELKKEMLKKR